MFQKNLEFIISRTEFIISYVWDALSHLVALPLTRYARERSPSLYFLFIHMFHLSSITKSYQFYFLNVSQPIISPFLLAIP